LDASAPYSSQPMETPDDKSIPRATFQMINAQQAGEEDSVAGSKIDMCKGEARQPRGRMAMSWVRTLRLFALSLALTALADIRPTSALDYPTKPVRFVVCFAAGGPNDIVARIFGQYLSDHFGQQFIIENRVGAGGNIGMASALASPADGYTIVFVGPNNAINASMYEKMPFDFIRDSAPVAGTMVLTNVMDVSAAVPANTVAEFIAYAKANPGKVNFASGGVGTSPHLSGELFKAMTGVNLIHVPYRGTAPALTDLLAGQVQVLFDNLPGSIGHIKAGKLRALGVTAAKRIAALPDIPAIAETVPGYEASVWYGIAVPKDTPAEIVDALNAAVNKGLADPKLQARVRELGGEPLPMTPAGFGKLVADETVKWAKVVKAAGVKVE
jgi:tripartite-type tricarboxylate transporter receptor subunit TctC